MQIFINCNGQNFGPYTIEEIRTHVAAGRILPSEPAWYQGATNWIPVQALLDSIPKEKAGFFGYESCSKCNCKHFEGSGSCCSNSGCGHAYSDH